MAYQRLSAGDRRARLVELGQQIFSGRPYDDFSMDDVAAAAGVSKGLLYHYFPSKRDFYVAALRASVDDMLAITEPDRSLPVEAQLRAGLAAYLGYVAGHAAAYRAVLRGGIGSDPDIAGVAEGFRRAMAERVLAGLAFEHPEPALRLAVMGWIGMVEAASLAWLERADLSLDEVVDLLATSLERVVEVATPPDPAN